MHKRVLGIKLLSTVSSLNSMYKRYGRGDTNVIADVHIDVCLE